MTSAIDPSKPAAVRPTMSSVRANFAAAKAEIEQLQGLIFNFVLNNQVTGITPAIVGSIRLAAGTYPPPSAQVGCGNPLKTATLELREPDGTVLCTVGGGAGGVLWRTADHGFTLTALTEIDLVLYASAANEPAFIHSFTF